MAAQPPLEREDPLPDPARRQRLHPGRDVEGRGRRRDVQGGRPSLPGNLASSSPARRAPTSARRAATRSTSRHLEIVGESHDYPITPKEHGVDYLLDRRHLWIRSERQQAILRIRHEVIDAVRDFFNTRGFILTDTPIFTPAACEGRPRCFPVEYFDDQKAYLTQSGQLYLEVDRDGARARLLVRPDVPRREVEDAPAPDRVLDGRARDGVRRTRRRDGPRRGPRGVGRRARARQARGAS